MVQQQSSQRAGSQNQDAYRSRSRGGRLTANAIQSLKPSTELYEITDPACAGLKIRVLPTGVKSWAFRFYWGKKRQLLGLGLWPDLGLSEARELAHKARSVLGRGIDPRTAGIGRRATAVKVQTAGSAPRPRVRNVPRPSAAGTNCNTRSVLEVGAERSTDLSENPNDVPSDPHSVGFLAHEFYHRHIVKERNRKRPAYVQRILNTDVLPLWANRDARTITPREVIELLDKVVDRGSPVMANRISDVLSQLFKYGIHRAVVDDSPVKLLYRPGGIEKPRERALSDTELKAFLVNYQIVCRTRRSAHVLMILLLTLQRRQELALAKKSEFDLQARTWSIPDEHAKKNRGHVLHLTDWAVEEISALMRLAGNSPYLLPRKDGDQPINPMLITRTVKRLQARFKKIGVNEFTPHDLRRTGRTGLAALGVAPEIAERLLNHMKKGMKRVYDRHEYFNEKRDALEKWAKYLSGQCEHAQ